MTKYVSILLDMAYFWHSPESSKTISWQTETNAHFFSIHWCQLSQTLQTTISLSSTIHFLEPRQRPQHREAEWTRSPLCCCHSTSVLEKVSTAHAGTQDTLNVQLQVFKLEKRRKCPISSMACWRFSLRKRSHLHWSVAMVSFSLILAMERSHKRDPMRDGATAAGSAASHPV